MYMKNKNKNKNDSRGSTIYYETYLFKFRCTISTFDLTDIMYK